MPARVGKTSKPIRDGSRLIAAVSLAGGAPINASRVRKDPKGPKASSARGAGKAGDPCRIVPFHGLGV